MKDSDYLKINNITPLYLIIDKVDRQFEKKNKTKQKKNNGNKYLIFYSTDKNKEVLIKYTIGNWMNMEKIL